MAGSAGAAGPSGDVGAQGPTGRTGAQGQAGIVGRWTAYRDFSFYGDQTDLQPSDVTMVNEIAGYMAQNPSLQIGIDGSTAPNGVAPTNQNLNDRRVDALHNALLAAGVPASKMQTGAFGDPQLRRDGRVEVLISTGSASTARSDN
jgi:outer membrane protein OmpA-like peptidoglycan-associated protein